MALFDLASRPEYIEPIREEIESIIAEEGWSKSSVMKMRKLESFLKESQRYSQLAGCKSPSQLSTKFQVNNAGTEISVFNS